MGIKATPGEIDAFLTQQGAGPGTSVSRAMTTNACVLVLPWPPSVNHYWKARIAGSKMKPFIQHYIGEQGRAFRENALAAIMSQGSPHVSGRVAVRIEVHGPDRRARDLDNLGKAALDALAHAGVIENDSKIDALAYRRRAVKPNGELVVRIRRFGVNYAGELFE